MIKNLIREYEPDELFYPKDQEELWNGFGQRGIFDEYGYCIRHQQKKKPTKVYKDLALLLTTSGSIGITIPGETKTQITSEIVKREPSFICIEDLNVKGMMKNRHLSKVVQQQGFL